MFLPPWPCAGTQSSLLRNHLPQDPPAPARISPGCTAAEPSPAAPGRSGDPEVPGQEGWQQGLGWGGSRGSDGVVSCCCPPTRLRPAAQGWQVTALTLPFADCFDTHHYCTDTSSHYLKSSVALNVAQPCAGGWWCLCGLSGGERWPLGGGASSGLVAACDCKCEA